MLAKNISRKTKEKNIKIMRICSCSIEKPVNQNQVMLATPPGSDVVDVESHQQGRSRSSSESDSVAGAVLVGGKDGVVGIR